MLFVNENMNENEIIEINPIDLSLFKAPFQPKLTFKMERLHEWWLSIKYVTREIKYMFLYCYKYRLPRKYGRQVS